MKNLSYKILVIVLMVKGLVSCENPYINDPIDPALPLYTEYGRNVAGAYVNNHIWRSVVELEYFQLPILVIDTLQNQSYFHFYGYSGSYNELSFRLNTTGVNYFSDLSSLSDSIIQLDGLDNIGYCPEADHPDLIDEMSYGVGQIYFTNIARRDEKIYFAGTFGFTYVSSAGDSIEVSYGRFDYSIDTVFNQQFLEESYYWK